MEDYFCVSILYMQFVQELYLFSKDLLKIPCVIFFYKIKIICRFY